jgi:hypothetical protein
MPEMTWLGWFHTIMGIAALLLAIAAISRHGVIKASSQTGAWYLIVTVIVAVQHLVFTTKVGLASRIS